MQPAPAARTPDGGPAAEARRLSNLFSRVTGTTALFGRNAPARTETAERPTAASEPAATRETAMPAGAGAPAVAQGRVAMPAISVGTASPARSAVAAAPQATVQQPVSRTASPAPMAATAQAMAQAAAIQPQPAPATAPAIPPVQQPRLAGLDPRERIASSRTEEAQLDIPAFLRRQAN
jgi:cell division protein FtsZ